MGRFQMKKRVLILTVAVLGLSSCGKIVKSTIESNPEIIFSAIKKDPEGFFKAIEETQGRMRELAKKKATEQAKKDIEEAFKNPQNPEIASNRALLGKKDAPITIVEYADFACYYCAEANKIISKVKKEYGDKVRFLFKHFHVLGNESSVYASKLMEGIGQIDARKAYKFHDTVFKNQDRLKKSGAKKFLEKEARKLVGAAKMPRVLKAARSAEVKSILDADKKEASIRFKLRGTPAFNVNGVTLRGAEKFEKFKEVIERHLNKKKEVKKEEKKS